MFDTLPQDARPVMDWEWSQLQPFYDDLAARPLTDQSVHGWLADWTRLSNVVDEAATRLRLAYDGNTTDPDIERRYFRFVEHVYPPLSAADQKLKERFLESKLEPEALKVPLRSMRAEAALFREENLPLFVESQKLISQYDKTVGAQTIEWEGQTVPLPQLRTALEDPDRSRREKAWRLMHQRKLQDRDTLNAVWRDLFALRQKVAANAGFSDYRAYVWQSYARFDYTPQDCQRFHDAIEQIVVPAATRLYQRRQQSMQIDTLRPWDLSDGAWNRPANPPDTQPLKPYRTSDELLRKTAAVLDRVDPQLGQHFHTMIDENLLDIENRKGKAPGGYCSYLPVIKRPFIFMNEVGVHDDVQTMLHEAGHAFHAFESAHLPYAQQLNPPMEFNEVASMGMELLSSGYLTASEGGFYSEADAVRARLEKLEQMIFFWPYMAVVDAFQHWAYTHPDHAIDPNACDAVWGDLYQRFLPALNWSGLQDELVTGWHRKLHIFHVPFYYVEYGLAALGAAQVWRNALTDQARAVAMYRNALALGNTASLPDLFAVAGARFAFDPDTVGEVVSLIESTIETLERSGMRPVKGMV